MPERKRILGDRQQTGERQRILGDRVPGGETRTRVGTAPPPVEPQHGGGGILGTIAHVLKQTPADLAAAAIHAPGGLYQVARAAGHDFKNVALHPTEHDHPSHLLPVVEGIAQATADTLRHPLRHPGDTLLLGLPAAGGAARGAVGASRAATAARAGEGAGAVLRTATRRPVFESRTLTRGPLEVKVGSSQSALGAGAQRVADKALHAAAESKPGGVADKLLVRKIGKAVTAEARTIQDVHKAGGAALIAMGRKLKPAEQKALQIVAEEAPIDARITAASARVTGAKTPKARARHQAELDLLHQAKPLLDTVGGKPTFHSDHAPKLGKVLEMMRTVATSREDLLKSLGQLTDEAIQSRKTNAGRVSLGATYEKPTPGKLGVPSRSLKREQTRLATLQRNLDKAHAVEAQWLKEQTPLQAAAKSPFADRIAQTSRDVAQAQALHDRWVTNQKATPATRFMSPSELLQASKDINPRDYLRDREHRAQVKLLAADLKANGFHEPVTLDKNGKLLDGLHRAIAARAAGITRVPVQVKGELVPRASNPYRNRLVQAGHALEQLQQQEARWAEKATPTTLNVSSPQRNRIVQLGHALELQQSRVAALEKGAATRVKPTGIIGAEHFAASPDAIRIPDVATRAGRSLGRPGTVGAAGTVGHLKAPGSTTHEYTGALREHGVRRQDTTRLVGEAVMESAKYAGLRHIHQIVRKAATAEPQAASDIAVRLDKLSSNKRMPLEVRKFLDNPDEFFRNATPDQTASAFEGVRSRLFISPGKLDPEAAAEFRKLQAEGKVGWVPKQLLGDLAKPHLPYTGKAVKGVDAINNASRFAILYLKPAYAIPNVLGNAALNILQQGFAAVPNLAYAARLNSHLGADLAARIDTLIGEGFARSISAHGQGLAAGVVDKAASVWSKGVDTPFRRSSFLYEARRAGFKSPQDIERLLTDPQHLEQLVEITQRANREIIDYANLTPTEREVVRRVVFFYPWVKGSTVYTARMLREHPGKSGAVAQLGQVGERTDPTAPTYLEGVFPIGDRLTNPNSAAIFNTPAQVGKAIAGLAGGDVGQVGELSNFLSPAAALALAAVTRRDKAGYQYPAGTNVGDISFDQLVKRLPQYTLGQRISDAAAGKGQDRLYPPNVRDAILQYVIGGIAPRKYNKAKLGELAANERSRYVP